jgi:elongation factor P--(R)-beta-lysine ligase
MHVTTSIQNLPTYKKAQLLIKETHSFLSRQGFLEILLPVLSPALIPESYLEVFETEFTFLDKKEKLYLTPSPELFMKRLLAQGIGNSYYLGKSFRNSEPTSTLHSHEFTMLEFYQVNAPYMDVAETVLKLLQSLAQASSGKLEVTYRGIITSLTQWEKLSVAEAFKKYSQIDEETLYDPKLFSEAAQKKGYTIEGFSYEDIFSQMYVQEVEPHLGMNGYPTLLYEYPAQMAALAKLNPDKKTAQRFEFYIAGIELGDCYTELIDWKEQELRFHDEQIKRKSHQMIDHAIDKEYIKTLQYGLIPCAGIAIGFDRLAMVFTGANSIDKLQLVTIL